MLLDVLLLLEMAKYQEQRTADLHLHSAIGNGSSQTDTSTGNGHGTTTSDQLDVDGQPDREMVATEAASTPKSLPGRGADRSGQW